jgi:hypothetical protein
MVKVREASSGRYLKTLHISEALFDISFDAADRFLCTEIGIFIISNPNVRPSPAPATAPATAEPQTPAYNGLALSSDRAWITRIGKLPLATVRIPAVMLRCVRNNSWYWCWIWEGMDVQSQAGER